jgi:hypothetical protein
MPALTPSISTVAPKGVLDMESFSPRVVDVANINAARASADEGRGRWQPPQ